MEFSLTGPQSAVCPLNEVKGGSGSQILGGLRSYYDVAGVATTGGRIFLINPNGILFGESARVNVGHLVASTLELQGDFADGKRPPSTPSMPPREWLPLPSATRAP